MGVYLRPARTILCVYSELQGLLFWLFQAVLEVSSGTVEGYTEAVRVLSWTILQSRALEATRSFIEVDWAVLVRSIL